jgi:DNA-directed RNA polymerase beta subunit
MGWDRTIYDRFFFGLRQAGSPPEPSGLAEIFRAHFPLTSDRGHLQLGFVTLTLESPRIDSRDALELGATYDADLFATFTLSAFGSPIATGPETGWRPTIDFVEERVVFARVALPTPDATFVICGTELEIEPLSVLGRWTKIGRAHV